MPRVTFDVTEDDQRMMDVVYKSNKPRLLRSDIAREWYLAALKKAYNKTPQSVLDGLAGKGNE